MVQIVHSKKARDDLLSIWAYIAQGNPKSADKLLDEIDKNCSLLGKNPQMGQARPDISPDMRYFPVKNYLILYQEQSFGVEVIRVLHGARDLNEMDF